MKNSPESAGAPVPVSSTTGPHGRKVPPTSAQLADALRGADGLVLDANVRVQAACTAARARLGFDLQGLRDVNSLLGLIESIMAETSGEVDLLATEMDCSDANEGPDAVRDKSVQLWREWQALELSRAAAGASK
jgi:hypothetical protein